MCGEHVRVFSSTPLAEGSPPHVRGAYDVFHCHNGRPRITPACAGSIFNLRPLNSTLEDHPRMCGEHASLSERSCFKVGSPPHVRGASQSQLVQIVNQGITPACAGSI